MEAAILDLPTPGIVVQKSETYLTPTDYSPGSEFDADSDDDYEDEDQTAASYVPIDPCQPVIAALRARRWEIANQDTSSILKPVATCPTRGRCPTRLR